MGNPTAGRVELTPAELDRLEDALEDLEFADLEVEPDDAVATRLHEFRDLLALSREAMPMEDVPAGLLDGVLEEARRAAVAVPAAAAQPSWWERLRGSWIPALAFAGSAAALLLVLWPKAEEDSAEATVAEAKPALQPEKADGSVDGRLADASRPARREEGQALDSLGGDELAIGQRGIGIETPTAAAPADDDAPEPEPEADPAWESKGEEQSRTVAKAPSKKSRGSSSGYGNGIGKSKPSAGALPGSSGGKKGSALPSAPKPAPKPAPPAEQDEDKRKEDKDVDPVWTEVTEGDRLRHAGNCGLAKMRYDKARKSDVARTRARGLAGRGLCEALAGNATAASKLFEQARASDPSVGAFIDAELGSLDGAPSGRPSNANESADLMFEDDAVKE